MKIGISLSLKFLTQFSPSTSKLHEFSPFNQILLSLFDVSNVFYNSFLANIEARMHQMV